MDKIEKIGIISNKSVLKNTGKSWDQWVQILNKNGALNLTHQEIVKILKSKYKQSLWWQQQIAISYGVYVGKRLPGQNSKGKYSATPVKTFPLAAGKMWLFLMSPKGQKIWLNDHTHYQLDKGTFFEARDGYYGEVRTVLKNKRLRLRWIESESEEKSCLQLSVLDRGKDKSMVVFQHDEITTAKEKEKFKTHWKEVLEKLYLELTPGKVKKKGNP